MKVKQDFVTNSSSTSFCAWGIEINDYFNNLSEDLKEMIYNKYTEWYKKNNKEFISFNEFIEDPYLYDWINCLTEILREYNLSCRCYHDGNIIYIGINPDDIPENETILEAKNKAKEKLKELGFSIKNFEFILESWYN